MGNRSRLIRGRDAGVREGELVLDFAGAIRTKVGLWVDRSVGLWVDKEPFCLQIRENDSLQVVRKK